jgi:phosphohistidine swiveling domain-containing protein
MANSAKQPPGCKPARYQIKIEGKLREDWSDWLGGMGISTQKGDEESRVTTLIGIVTDQAALRGILCNIWDLNLTILSVSHIDMHAGKKESEKMSNDILSFDEITAEQRVFAGGKGGSLARLYQAGYPVPTGFVILPSAFDGEDLTPQAWAQVQQHLTVLRTLDPEISFAVRSSALSEDSANASFAGEFETVLNMHSDEDIHKAILMVYCSRKSERVQAYSRVKGINAAHEIAVVVQQLVKAESSGVLFTANPVTGQRDQAMLTATWGLGEAIVGGMVTPDMLIVNKKTGCILTREIADKQVMTILLKDGTVEHPVPEKKRRAPVLSDAQAAELVRFGVQIEELYGMPMDIEWVSIDNKIKLVQARPITTLPEPEPPAPTTWKLPKGQYAAMRNNIVELMPTPMTPLFDTLGRAAFNASFGRLLTHFLGKTGVMPDEIIISVNGYAYNNGSARPLQAFGMVLDMVGILKRMLIGAVERWTVDGRPPYVAAIESLRAAQWRQFSSNDLVNAACELYEAAVDAYGALISGVIPAAWISEALFTKFYNTFIKRRGDPSAQTFLLGFDSTPIQAEKNLYDLSDWVRAHTRLAAYLSSASAPQLAAQLENAPTPPEVDANDWHEWQDRFRAHLQRYGHTIYDLDFSNPVPADDPAPLLETCQLFISGQGANPHTRQLGAIERREQAQQTISKKLKGLRLKYFNRYLALAQRFAPLREDGLADVGLGYPLLRQMLRELGRRFVTGGLLENPDDVFWLTKDEVAQAAARLDGRVPLTPLGIAIPQRKAAWRAARRVTPPMMLPQMKVFGFDLMELKSGRGRKQKGNTIKGVAASPGSVTATACVLHGPEDFSKMKTGDVLVAAITTPAWTPLFARAAAVVTDVGGPLSHGSIVAREYGIPAVLGTSVATQRIRNGQKITVDGTSGTVLLL